MAVVIVEVSVEDCGTFCGDAKEKSDRLGVVIFSGFICMQVARHTMPEGHFKVGATINYFCRGRCHLLLGLKLLRVTSYTVHTDVGLVIINLKPGW